MNTTLDGISYCKGYDIGGFLKTLMKVSSTEFFFNFLKKFMVNVTLQNKSVSNIEWLFSTMKYVQTQHNFFDK